MIGCHLKAGKYLAGKVWMDAQNAPKSTALRKQRVVKLSSENCIPFRLVLGKVRGDEEDKMPMISNTPHFSDSMEQILSASQNL